MSGSPSDDGLRGEREDSEAEAVASVKERDGAVATYRRRWRRSRTGAIGRRRLQAARSGAGV
jgi:hypothetical protein